MRTKEEKKDMAMNTLRKQIPAKPMVCCVVEIESYMQNYSDVIDCVRRGLLS